MLVALVTRTTKRRASNGHFDFYNSASTVPKLTSICFVWLLACGTTSSLRSRRSARRGTPKRRARKLTKLRKMYQIIEFISPPGAKGAIYPRAPGLRGASKREFRKWKGPPKTPKRVFCPGPPKSSGRPCSGWDRSKQGGGGWFKGLGITPLTPPPPNVCSCVISGEFLTKNLCIFYFTCAVLALQYIKHYILRTRSKIPILPKIYWIIKISKNVSKIKI